MRNPGVVIIAACSLVVLALAACADPDSVAVDEQLAIACADGPTVKGIDVSFYEDSVDWDTVHAAGIDFAFIRVTDGLQYTDPRFPGYWAGARDAGVIRGAYQFFRPSQDPIAQADRLLALMGPLQPGDLPPVIDVEVDGGLTPAQVEASVRAWVDHVTSKLGRVPIVYAGLYSWPRLTNSADLTSSPLWVAQYTSAACPNIPVPWTRWMFWQHSSTGSVPGIPGATLDLNVFNGTLEDLRAFTMPGPCGDGICSGADTVATCAQDCRPCGTIAHDGGTIDDGDACFYAGGPTQYLRGVNDAGSDDDLIWTHATSSAREANFAHWDLHFAASGRYRVDAYTDAAYASSTRAAYVIHAGHAGASNATTTTVTLDQTAQHGWQPLGEHDFAAGGGLSIHLGDNTGEAVTDDAQLVFDAIRFTRIAVPVPPSEPPPSAPPPSEPSPPPSEPPPGEPATPIPPIEIGGCTVTPTASWPIALSLLALRRRRRSAR